MTLNCPVLIWDQKERPSDRGLEICRDNERCDASTTFPIAAQDVVLPLAGPLVASRLLLLETDHAPPWVAGSVQKLFKLRKLVDRSSNFREQGPSYQFQDSIMLTPDLSHLFDRGVVPLHLLINQNLINLGSQQVQLDVVGNPLKSTAGAHRPQF